MRISGFLKGNKEGIPCFLVLDIGTQFTKAVVFEVDSESDRVLVGGIGKVEHGLSLHLIFNPVLVGAVDKDYREGGAVVSMDGIQQSCKEAISKAEKMAGVSAKRVILGVAGGLVKGSTVTTAYKRERPEAKIDLLELKYVLQKVQWRVFDEIRKRFVKEFSQPEMGLKLIDATVTDVKIDDYSISNPLGFRGKEISLAISNIYAPSIYLNTIEDLILQLGLDLLAIVPEPYTIVYSLGIKKSSDLNAIFIDIGGRSTNISLICEGKLEGEKIFDIGGRSFTKILASYLGVGIPEAEDIKIKYSKKELGPRAMRELRKVFGFDVSVWLLGVELAIKEFVKDAPETFLPFQVFLFGGGSMLRDIKEFLEKRDWLTSLKFRTKPRFNFLFPQDIVSVRDMTSFLKEPSDVPPLLLATLSLDLLKEEGIFSPILKRIVKIMQK